MKITECSKDQMLHKIKDIKICVSFCAQYSIKEEGSLPSKDLKLKIIDVALILRFRATVCVVWCGTGF